jgi:hypothetical protein
LGFAAGSRAAGSSHRARQEWRPGGHSALSRPNKGHREKTGLFSLRCPLLARLKTASGSLAAIAAAVASGELPPTEAGELSKVVDTYARALLANELGAVSTLWLLWLVRLALHLLRLLRRRMRLAISPRCRRRQSLLVEPLLRVHWLLLRGLFAARNCES